MSAPLSEHAVAFLDDAGYHEATFRRNLLLGFCEYVSDPDPDNLTDDAVEAWLEDVQATRSALSAKRYASTVRAFLQHLRDLGVYDRSPLGRTQDRAVVEDPRFAEVVERHLADLRRRGRRPTTMYQRRRVLIRLARWTGEPDLFGVTQPVLEEYLDRGLMVESLACELSHLQQFYQWAYRSGLTSEDPTAALGRPRVPRRLPRPIPDADLAVALEQAPNRIRPWLYLAAYAGLRAAEIAQMRAESLHIEADPPLIVIDESKGGGMSSVPMAPQLVDVLRSCGLPRSGYLFRRHDGQPGPNAPHLISHMANAYLRSQGIDSTLHSLRHWFGTNTYRSSGRDLRVTQELLRHSTPISTAIYTYVDPADGVRAVGNLPTFPQTTTPATEAT